MTAPPREHNRATATQPQRLRSYSRNGDADSGANHSRSSSAPVETTCQRCGEQVTRRFVRVYAECDAQGVFGCQACYSITAITRGAARPDHDGTERERQTAAKRGKTGGQR